MDEETATTIKGTELDAMSSKSPGETADDTGDAPPSDDESTEDLRLRNIENDNSGASNNEESDSDRNNESEIAEAPVRQAESNLPENQVTSPRYESSRAEARGTQGMNESSEVSSPLTTGNAGGADNDGAELDESLPDDELMHQIIKELCLSRMRGYMCEKCGEPKIRNKDGVNIPHLCPALEARVKKAELSGVLFPITEEHKVELRKQAQKKLEEDTAANEESTQQSETAFAERSEPTKEKAKARGSYKCGRCGAPKKGHICHFREDATEDEDVRKPAAKPHTPAALAQSSKDTEEEGGRKLAVVHPTEEAEDEDSKPAAKPRKPAAPAQPCEKAKIEEGCKPAAHQRKPAGQSLQVPAEVEAETSNRETGPAMEEEARPLKRRKIDDPLEDNLVSCAHVKETTQTDDSTAPSQHETNPTTPTEDVSTESHNTSLSLEASTSLDMASQSQDDHLDSSSAPQDRSPEHNEEDDDIEPETGSNPSLV